MWVPIIFVILALLPITVFGQNKPEAPIKTTLCEIMRDTERFNGKIVQVPAVLVEGFELTAIIDKTCLEKIWLSVGNQGDAAVDADSEFASIESASEIQRPDRLNWKRLSPLRPLTSDQHSLLSYLLQGIVECPMCETSRLFTGRFDHADHNKMRAVRRRSTGQIRITPVGFGHLGYWESELVLESISEVAIKKTNAQAKDQK
jgi:hypothetical protein